MEREEQMRERGFVNKAQLIERGWTRTAIKRLLGEPDHRTLTGNCNKDRPECCYDTERVLQVEADWVVAGRMKFVTIGLSIAQGVRFRRSKHDVPASQKRGFRSGMSKTEND